MVDIANIGLPAGMELARTERGLALRGDGMELVQDFSDLLGRLRPDRLSRELLVRAARVKGRGAPASAVGAAFEGGPGAEPPFAVDATAGLGEDAFLLAAAGFSVLLCESDPVICALLQDALERARIHPDPRLAAPAARMRVHAGDSIGALAGLDRAPDVVYLDPMFPARRKSAAVKKKFQLLHRLEAPCSNEGEMLAAAIAARPRKVVIKRPVKAPCLAGAKPSHSIGGKAVRFDVIVPA